MQARELQQLPTLETHAIQGQVLSIEIAFDEAPHIDYGAQIDKMKQLEAGTRKFNAKAASTEKLRVNRQICQSYNLPIALDILLFEAEAITQKLFSFLLCDSDSSLLNKYLQFFPLAN